MNNTMSQQAMPQSGANIADMISKYLSVSASGG